MARRLPLWGGGFFFPMSFSFSNETADYASAPEPHWRKPQLSAQRLLEEYHHGQEGIHPLIQALLKLREIDPQEAGSFFHPRLRSLRDPFLLPEMSQAVERLHQAITKKQPILLYGDYDVDGLTSLTITQKCLQALGAEVHSFIPRRLDEGYGLSEAGLERALREFAAQTKTSKPDLLIALDCGTNSAQLIAQLQAQGIDSLIVDHHQLTSERPNSLALVNAQLGEDAELKTLCTAALAFKLFHAVLKTHPELAPKSLDLRDYLDLVALATIADVCPLQAENRLFVHHGLRRISHSTHPGLAQLAKLCDLPSQPSASDVSFRIAPRINAAGRLNRAEDALKLLLCENEGQARQIAQMLDECNRKRQQIQAEVESEAEEQLTELSIDAPALVLAHENWHPGVVGIVAGKLCRRYARPAFVLAIGKDGIAHGSARSVEEVSLAAGLEACSEHLVSGGGHAAAAGISLEAKKLPDFVQAFTQWLAQQGLGEARAPQWRPEIELPLELCDQALLEQWPLLEPFGHGFAQPLFMLRGCHPLDEPRWLKNRHLKLQLEGADDYLDALWFHAADHLSELPPPPWDILAELSINEFRGLRSLQLFIQDLRRAKP